MLQPLVSIICICYNHEAFVHKAIHSVLKQTYKNIELIVVNNASSDNSSAKIRELLDEGHKFTFLEYAETISNTKAFNKAYIVTKGEYLIDLSADDVLIENCVEKQINFFLKQTTNTGLIFGNAFHINENGERTAPYFEVDKNNKVIDKALFKTDYQKLLRGGLSICSVSSMFTRKHFKELNGYDENLFFEDLDYWFRLSRQFEIKFLDDFLVEKRFLTNSLGNKFFNKDKTAKRINQSIRKIYKQAIEFNTYEENKLLRKRIHNSMVRSFNNKNYSELVKLSLLELQSRFKYF